MVLVKLDIIQKVKRKKILIQINKSKTRKSVIFATVFARNEPNKSCEKNVQFYVINKIQFKTIMI